MSVRVGTSVTTAINAGATPTFSIFVTGSGTVPFYLANNRIFVRFRDTGGVTRGSTSVAVRTSSVRGRTLRLPNYPPRMYSSSD